MIVHIIPVSTSTYIQHFTYLCYIDRIIILICRVNDTHTSIDDSAYTEIERQRNNAHNKLRFLQN